MPWQKNNREVTVPSNLLTSDENPQLALAALAAEGNLDAREKVNTLLEPVIRYQTDIFCKRFCYQNRYIYRCSLASPWGNAPTNALLCEWGNASYGWMLDDLSSPSRLLKFENRNGASLFDYFYQIANSLPFYERWKDWRFGRKVYVPTYIQSLGPASIRIFYELKAGRKLAFISQKLNLSELEVETRSQEIMRQLIKRGKLHLLDPQGTVSLSPDEKEEAPTGSGGNVFDTLMTEDEGIESIDEKQRLYQAWSELETVEQYVLEALVIENQDAQSVLQALITLDIRIKEGVLPEDTSVQQLYYFKRKVLAKLSARLDSQNQADDR